MENECEALPGVAYPGVRDNRSTLNTKTGHDDDDDCAVKQTYSKKNSQNNIWRMPMGATALNLAVLENSLHTDLKSSLTQNACMNRF